MKVDQLKFYEVIDSRGNPTIACKIFSGKFSSISMVPSGASTGSKEAQEIRDNDKKRFLGKGLKEVIKKTEHQIFDVISQKNLSDQQEIDNGLIELDGSKNKSNIGANMILATSMAVSKLASQSENMELFQYIHQIAKAYEIDCDYSLPLPMMNILNGGAHANNPLEFQEFMIQPAGFENFDESLRAGIEIFHNLKKELQENNFSTSVGDEGGFAPDISDTKKALDFICSAVEKSGYKMGEEIFIAMDCAASEIFINGEYLFEGKNHDNSGLIQIYEELIKRYPIKSIEDPLDEDDWDGWKAITKQIGDEVSIVGDDLFVTNKKILEKGINNGSANSILIKVNQIGTVSETLETISLANQNNINTVISHRSGETEDTFISDLAVGIGAGQIKTGAPSRSDRTAKYNRLLMINSDNNFSFEGMNGIKQ